MSEGLDSDFVMQMADFSKEKAEMGHVCQREERKEVNVALDFLQSPRACHQKHFLSRERKSSNYKGFLSPQEKLRKVYMGLSPRARYWQKR